MSTRQRVVASQQQNEEQVQWQSVFAMNAVKSYANSVAFMRKLTVIALSTITYIRNILPDDCYSTHLFSGLNLSIIREKAVTEKSKFIASSLQAALEAFDKRYLRKLAFCVFKDESKPETLLESYIFTFTYTDNSTAISLESNSQTVHSTLKDVQSSTTQLLSNIVEMTRALNSPLPPDYDMSFRAYYYDDVTPVDYQPRGFEPNSCDQDPLELFSNQAHKFGHVKTPFHKVGLKIINDGITAAVADMEMLGKSPVKSVSATTSTYSTHTVRCPCCFSVADDSPSPADYVQCTSCNTIQHSACFGLTSDDKEAIECHVCDECALGDPWLACSDPKLVGMQTEAKKNFCVYRRILMWCSGMLYLNGERILESFQLSRSRTLKYMDQLETNEVIYPLPPGEMNNFETDRKVNKQALKRLLPSYFPRKERNIQSLSDQLLQQINLTPQECADVDNMPPPSNALGKITSRPAAPRAADDVSEFRRALTCGTEEEELPLSGPHNPVQEIQASKKGRGVKRKAEAPPVATSKRGSNTKRKAKK